MATDLVQGVLTDELLKELLAQIADWKMKLTFLINLSAQDREGLPKMGDKSRAFVDQGLNLALQNEGILPRNFDLEEYQRDVELTRRLETLLASLHQLVGSVEDTALAAGSDAYTATLVVYQAAKMAGKDGALDNHLDNLARRFARRATKPDNPSTKQG